MFGIKTPADIKGCKAKPCIIPPPITARPTPVFSRRIRVHVFMVGVGSRFNGEWYGWYGLFNPGVCWESGLKRLRVKGVNEVAEPLGLVFTKIGKGNNAKVGHFCLMCCAKLPDPKAELQLRKFSLTKFSQMHLHSANTRLIVKPFSL